MELKLLSASLALLFLTASLVMAEEIEEKPLIYKCFISNGDGEEISEDFFITKDNLVKLEQVPEQDEPVLNSDARLRNLKRSSSYITSSGLAPGLFVGQGLSRFANDRTMPKYPKRFSDDESNLRFMSKHLARNKNIVNVAYPNERKMLPRLY